jgi:hypothetical protein
MSQRGTQGTGLTDELSQIAGQVRDQLRGRLQNFLLVAAEHGLVLEGRSRTYYAKQLAQELVMQSTKMPIKANSIEVM